MTRALLSRELLGERTVPWCPHCHSTRMVEATITLEDLAMHWPLPGFVEVMADGYADPRKAALLVWCPDCEHPSVPAIDGVEIKLVAARTEKDMQFREGSSWTTAPFR